MQLLYSCKLIKDNHLVILCNCCDKYLQIYVASFLGFVYAECFYLLESAHLWGAVSSHGGSGSTPAAGVAVRANVHAFRAPVHEQLQNVWTLIWTTLVLRMRRCSNETCEVHCVLTLETSSQEGIST